MSSYGNIYRLPEMKKMLTSFTEGIDILFSKCLTEWRSLGEYTVLASTEGSPRTVRAELRPVSPEKAGWTEDAFLGIDLFYLKDLNLGRSLWEPVFIYVCTPHVIVADRELRCLFQVDTFVDTGICAWNLYPTEDEDSTTASIVCDLLANMDAC